MHMSRVMLLDLLRGSILGMGGVILREVKLAETPHLLRHACSGCGKVLYLDGGVLVDGVVHYYCENCGSLYYSFMD